MMTLLYKEIRLAAHPTSIVFAFLGCLVLVPAYPYSVIFMFGCLAPYITFLNARETNDAWYTAILPVTKSESVLGKCLLIVSVQMFQLLFSIPFAFLRNALNIERTDIDGVLEMNLIHRSYDVLIYDNVPGGAGHVKRLVDKKAIIEVLQSSYQKVSQNCCDENTSCYNCLRNYYNQSYHGRLKRKYAKSYIETLLNGITGI